MVGLPADFHNHFLFLTSAVIDLPWPYFFSRIFQRDILDFLSPTDISCAHAGGLFHFDAGAAASPAPGAAPPPPAPPPAALGLQRRRDRLPRPQTAPGGAGASTPALPPPPPPAPPPAALGLRRWRSRLPRPRRRPRRRWGFDACERHGACAVGRRGWC